MKKLLIALIAMLSVILSLSAQEKSKEPIRPALLVIDMQNQFLPMMDQEGKDFTYVIKTYGDGFNKTDLEKVLRDLKVNTVFLCGLSATGCVISTYIGAKNHDFKAFLVKDGMLSHKKDYTEQIETIFDAVGYEVVEVMLDNAE